jgi:uncharacterized membrane protein
MGRGRLEAFSDGVIAILITIMVLELKVPEGEKWSALGDRSHEFLAYVLSFVYLGIYWNNHHHMLHLAERVSGSVLWANLHLLFWLSLVPVGTAWMGQHHEAADPAAMYGVILLGSAFAYTLLQTRLVRLLGPGSTLASAVGSDKKGKLSIACYVAGIASAYVVHPMLANGFYAAVALIWIVPDRRIERQLPS